MKQNKETMDIKSFVSPMEPTIRQQSVITSWFGSSRYIYNSLLELFRYRDRYRNAAAKNDTKALRKLKLNPDVEYLHDIIIAETYSNNQLPSVTIGPNIECCKIIINILQSHNAWLEDCPMDMLVGSANDFCDDYPTTRFKRKDEEQQLHLTEGLDDIFNNDQKLMLPTTPTLRAKGLTPGYVETKCPKMSNSILTSLTIVKHLSDEYTVKTYYKGEVPKQDEIIEPTGKPIKIIKLEARLRFLEDCISRQVEGSNRYKRTEVKINTCKYRLANIKKALSYN